VCMNSPTETVPRGLARQAQFRRAQTHRHPQQGCKSRLKGTRREQAPKPARGPCVESQPGNKYMLLVRMPNQTAMI
jgi:hypothetical protein